MYNEEVTSIYGRPSDWMDGSGPLSDIVMSSRIRLARNVAGFLFYQQADSTQQQDIYNYIHSNLMETELKEQMWFIDMEDVAPVERSILTERQLISRRLAESQGPCGVALAHNESTAVMINEEDHIRIQALASGLQLEETYEHINRIDDLLEDRMEFAFSEKLGYLTACPTNVGTGIRVSVMLHLPGLKMTGQLEKAFRAAKEMHLAVRGLHGEGTEPVGDLYQLSNQTTLGKSELQIINDFTLLAVEPIVEYERRARAQLLKDKIVALDDKIHRAVGVLSNARLITSEETAYLLSLVRLGIHLNRIQGIDLKTVNELFLLTQPGHLQHVSKKELSASERDEVRAEFVRRRFH